MQAAASPNPAALDLGCSGLDPRQETLAPL